MRLWLVDVRHCAKKDVPSHIENTVFVLPQSIANNMVLHLKVNICGWYGDLTIPRQQEEVTCPINPLKRPMMFRLGGASPNVFVQFGRMGQPLIADRGKPMGTRTVIPRSENRCVTAQELLLFGGHLASLGSTLLGRVLHH